MIKLLLGKEPPQCGQILFGEIPADKFGRAYEAKTGQKYSKEDEKMYGKLCMAGDEEKVIQIA